MIDKKVLEATLEVAIDYFEDLESRHVGPIKSVEELRRDLAMDLPEKGEDPLEVIRDMAVKADGGLVASPGPRYFGFVTGGAVPASLGADWLTSVWDQNGMISLSSPAAGVVEEVVSSWVLELLGLPSGSSVGFVTGCQMANFTCLAAARNHVLNSAGWDVEKQGLSGAPHVNIVVGAEAHVTLINALKMLGFGTENIRYITADGQGRMIPSELEKMLSSCNGPIILSVQAGNVNTGAFDPCEEIIEIAHRYGAWVHVDGAFGLWGKLNPVLAAETGGVELADSWATDAHKWLNVPYDSGIAIVARPEPHKRAMAPGYVAYLPGQGEKRDPSQWVPESSRRARGFTLYAAIRSLGKNGLCEMVERHCRQARLMASLLKEDPDIQILNEVVLNQVLVRFRDPEGIDDSGFTRRVMSHVQEEGTCWAGGSRWEDSDAMRISVSNWATTDEDIKISAQAIRRVLARLVE